MNTRSDMLAAMKNLIAVVERNPVVLAAVVRVAIYAGSYFGLHLDATAIIGEVAALETVSAPLVRRRVMPMPKVPVDASTLTK